MSGQELIIVLVVLLLLFGARRIPGLGRSLEVGVREFKQGISGEEPPEGEARSERNSPPGGPVRNDEGPERQKA